MKVAVWKTGHEIADTIAEVIHVSDMHGTDLHSTNSIGAVDFAKYDAHIAYGILRGTDEVFKRASANGKPWFNIDRGYWKPNHYDGYYRVSLCGTQQTFGLDKLEPDYARWDALGLEILPVKERNGYVLVCPPTEHAQAFFPPSSMPRCWPNEMEYVRYKNSVESLQLDLDKSKRVVTFNSSVGWEALRQGIPVISDPTHSIVGAYQKLVDKSIHDDSNERRRLFAIMAGLQLTLEEIRSGLLWPLLTKPP